ncbi:GtrA family protein [Oscillospiraceae bacterium NSJ-54]|uniref:GtrA family protein n=2 Tax=Zongyangia hominis TaxID=2763677 RepID=A0A926EE36_9FIRM|nr:GtrA family protein [Zongyangia hominis]
MEKIKALFVKYKEIILYVFFGGLTTVVNFVVYLGLKNLLGVPMVASNITAWAVSVLFAYVTNKLYVFESRDMTPRAIVRELVSFVAARLFSGVVDTGMLVVLVDFCHMNDVIVKIMAQVVVVILNYIFSKLWIFKKGKEE